MDIFLCCECYVDVVLAFNGNTLVISSLPPGISQKHLRVVFHLWLINNSGRQKFHLDDFNVEPHMLSSGYFILFDDVVSSTRI